jgi:hypothetical protein
LIWRDGGNTKRLERQLPIHLKADMEEEDLTRRMELEFENEVSLADMEDSAMRDDAKRKDDGTGKVRKAKKRKLEKLVNWGMEEEGDSVDQAEETTGVTDWVVKKQVSLASKGWLLAPISSKP